MTGKQVQRSITGKTQKEVAQKMKEIAVDIDRAAYQAPCRLTVAEWLEIWQKEYLYDVRLSTAQLYKRSLTLYVIPNIGKVKLEALTPHMIQRMLNALSQQETRNGTLSPKTVKNVRGILHKALQQAVENQYIRCNPVTACEPPRSVKTEIQPMTEEQQAAFLREIRGHQHEYLYLIALFTGIRESEVLGLTWDCVDFRHGTLTVKQQLKTVMCSRRCACAAPSTRRRISRSCSPHPGKRLPRGNGPATTIREKIRETAISGKRKSLENTMFSRDFLWCAVQDSNL